MTRKTILLVGAGGHARACIDVIEQEDLFDIAGLVGQPNEVGLDVLGYRVLGTDADLRELMRRYGYGIVAVGQIKSADTRAMLCQILEQGRCVLPVIVSPLAYVSRHAVLGAGTIVMHGAIVNAGATVGRNCIINSQALVEHDAIVGDHCHIATAAVLNSGVRIGTATFVGSNSCVRQGTTIGERCVIGMGERIISDWKDQTRTGSLEPRSPGL